jgi:hypothetical protein
MDLTALFQAVFSINNLPVSVLILVCGAQFYLLHKWRQETREDQKGIVEALNKNTEAMTQLRIAVAANTGRAS